MTRIAFAVFVATLLAAPALAAETPAAAAAWERMRFFVGSWSGEGRGEPGVSNVERDYRFVLGDRFIEVRNQSRYAPQEKNPKGETHEDRGFFSWDRGGRRLKLRQFHVEGFVNEFVADSVSAAADSLVFTTIAIENLPAGFRGRETYRILGPDEFVERFEIAEPGGDFALYSESRLKRKK